MRTLVQNLRVGASWRSLVCCRPCTAVPVLLSACRAGVAHDALAGISPIKYHLFDALVTPCSLQGGGDAVLRAP